MEEDINKFREELAALMLKFNVTHFVVAVDRDKDEFSTCFLSTGSKSFHLAGLSSLITSDIGHLINKRRD